MSIKLKHSGGNSVSLNPPTSAPTSSDVAFKLPNADGSANQIMKTDGSGNLGWATDQSGKILQLKSTSTTTQVQYTSTSFTVTNMTVNITPSSASSKIFISSFMNLYKSGSSAFAIVSIYRDSTNLGSSSYGFGEFSNLGSNGGVFASPQHVDSPNTTSQVTYAIYVKVNSGHNVYICSNSTPANITVMEVAA